MKKRIISLLCAVLMLTAVCVPAFAAGNGDDGIVTYGYDDEYYCIKINGKTREVPANIIVGYKSSTTFVGPTWVLVDTGKHVTTAQMALCNVASLYGKNCRVAIDGIYGSETNTAVCQFQADYHLDKIDGAVGPHTWGKFVDLCR